ncbi:MAG: DUF3795 domain-containing protein [Oscillospiraceae bacterium]
MCCSKCGANCSVCSRREEFGCLGCNEMQSGYWGEKCELKECCEEKKLEHCGLCPDFPCEMVREISFDEELGDDGERLLNAKKWADETGSVKDKKLKNILLGVSLGVVFGAVIGAWQGMYAAFIVCGVIVGTGIAVLINIDNKK